MKDNYKILGDKIEIELKRHYEVKDLLINVKNMNKFKTITISYLDLNKEYQRLGKFKNGEAIPPFDMIGSSLVLEFECPISKKGSYQCMYCGNAEDLSIICSGCARNLDINGQFKAIGG